MHWKDRCWSWNSNTLATWCEELIHWKRPWCWERLKAGGEGDDRGWDGWMASPTWWTWVWVSSGSWWWTGKPGMLQSMGSQRVGHKWATELNWYTVAALEGVWHPYCLASRHLCWSDPRRICLAAESQLCRFPSFATVCHSGGSHLECGQWFSLESHCLQDETERLGHPCWDTTWVGE